MKQCPRCGAIVEDFAASCPKCGVMFTQSQQSPYGAPQGFGQQPYGPGPGQPVYSRSAAKNKTTAGILAIVGSICLAGLPLQYYYLGKSTPSIIFSLVWLFSWLTFIFGIGILGLSALGLLFFIQGIIILTQTDQQFDQKFANPSVSFPLF